MRPASTRSKVVFPAPFGPRTSVSPGPTSTLMALRIRRSSMITVVSRRDAVGGTARMMGRVLIACIVTAAVVGSCAPEPAATDPIARGRQVYRQMNCGSCHDPDLIGRRIGPPLDHIGTVAATPRPRLSAEGYIRPPIPGPG